MARLKVIGNKWFPLAAAVIIVAIIAFFLLSRMGEGSKLPVEGDAPAFSLQNTEGETITLDNTAGKTRLIYFFFAHCPDVCLPTNNMLSQVQEGLKEKGLFGDEAILMSVTFDPERDTVEYLKEYMSKMNADPTGWHYLRSDDVEYVRSVAESYGVTVIPSGEDFIHANLYTLIDGDGKIRKIYSPNEVLLGYSDKTIDELVDEIVQDMWALSK